MQKQQTNGIPMTLVIETFKRFISLPFKKEIESYMSEVKPVRLIRATVVSHMSIAEVYYDCRICFNFDILNFFYRIAYCDCME